MTTFTPPARSPLISPHDYAALLRSDLVAFIHRAFCDLNPQTLFMPAPYIELMASRLEDCRSGKSRRLIINLPPRSLKSHCVSIAFAAWLLGHNPATQIIAASYGQDLADKLARDTRTLMEADWYRALFPTRLSARKAVNDFTTTAGGTRMATSVGGVLTGRGADVIVIDDPLKPDQALSEVGRKAVNEWYDNTLLSRLNNKRTGCIIVVMQRLHQDDLIGHVLPQDDWTVLSFPAIAEEAECVPFWTPYGTRRFIRQPGEALHPDREAVAEYEAMRRRIGLYNFSSQYQQRPIPISGNLVKREWLRSYGPDDVPRRFMRIVQSWDTAAKTSELNDYSVCTTWGVERENYYLIDVFRRRLNYPDLKRAIVSHAERFDADKIVIEGKSSALSSSRTFRTTASGRSSSTNRHPAPTRSCACTPAVTGSKAAGWSCRATPPGSTSTSLSSSAFQAQNTTTRSTRPPRRSTTSASLTSSLPTSRHFRGDVNIQQLSDGCCRSA